nr:Nicotinamide-nucleotide amidohydrolase PncC [Cupriavidus sp.]
MTDDSSQRSVPFFTVSERAILTLGLTLGGLAQASGIRLGLAESCTGGLAASWVTAVPGSSHWFEGGVVSYSNALKSAVLGVSEELLASHGAVSRPVAQAMAHGLRHRLMRTHQHHLCKGWATAAITGVAGPTGGSPDKPLGLVWFGWEFPNQSAYQEACIFSGDRQAIQRQAAWWSLQRLAWGLIRPPA